MPVPALEWRETTRADLLAIIESLSDDNPDAAWRLKDDIQAKVSKLLEYPKLYERVASPAREKWWCERTTCSSMRKMPAPYRSCVSCTPPSRRVRGKHVEPDVAMGGSRLNQDFQSNFSIIHPE